MKLMKEKKSTLPIPAIAAIAATRGMMGFGAGLLMSKKLGRGTRKKVGWSLVGLGAATTLPLLAYVRRH